MKENFNIIKYKINYPGSFFHEATGIIAQKHQNAYTLRIDSRVDHLYKTFEPKRIVSLFSTKDRLEIKSKNIKQDDYDVGDLVYIKNNKGIINSGIIKSKFEKYCFVEKDNNLLNKKETEKFYYRELDIIRKKEGRLNSGDFVVIDTIYGISSRYTGCVGTFKMQEKNKYIISIYDLNTMQEIDIKFSRPEFFILKK